MTFIQGIVRPEHIWLCTDNRVSRDNRFENDDHVKYVGIRCADGTALLSYTGRAELADGTKLSEWVRAVIRGVNRTVESTVQVLAECATKEFCTYTPLPVVVFVIAAFVNQQASLYQIANIANINAWKKPFKHFKPGKVPLDNPLYYMAGSGSSFVTRAERERLANIIARKPRNPKDFLNLLISINEKVSERDTERVSRSCIAAEIPEKGEPVTIVGNGSQHITSGNIPFVLFGLDTTEMMQLTRSQLPGGKNYNLSVEEISKLQDDIATRSVTPRKIK